MNEDKINPELLVELAKEVEVTDPIDWGMLNVNEEDSYRLMALHVAEMDDNTATLKAIITKLLVENFVLNLKLLQRD